MTAVLDFFSTDRWSNLANTGTAGCQHRVAEEYHPYGNKLLAFFFLAGAGGGGVGGVWVQEKHLVKISKFPFFK